MAGESTPVERAIEQLKSILEASVGTDEHLAEAIVNTDQKALGAVRSFLKTVADHGASCALEFRGDIFSFADVAQVQRSANRLAEDNIQEHEVEFLGRFHGFLPDHRQAEFSVAATAAKPLRDLVGKPLLGRVEPEVAESVQINDILNQQIRITVRVRRVGQGGPRYTITRCESAS